MNTSESWVVYLMTVTGKQPGRHAVCSKAEWGEMESARPGYHALVRRVAGSEGEAEKYARGLQPLPVSLKKQAPPRMRLTDASPMGLGCVVSR